MRECSYLIIIIIIFKYNFAILLINFAILFVFMLTTSYHYLLLIHIKLLLYFHNFDLFNLFISILYLKPNFCWILLKILNLIKIKTIYFFNLMGFIHLKTWLFEISYYYLFAINILAKFQLLFVFFGLCMIEFLKN